MRIWSIQPLALMAAVLLRTLSHVYTKGLKVSVSHFLCKMISEQDTETRVKYDLINTICRNSNQLLLKIVFLKRTRSSLRFQTCCAIYLEA